MKSMDNQMSPDGYVNFDHEECTSLPEINSNEADWRDTFIEAWTNEYVTEREVEVLSSDMIMTKMVLLQVQKQLNCDQL